MPRQAPKFAEKDNCFQCNTGFGLFTRRHHCRNCGHSLCGTCLTQSLPLPHFGMSDPQKVCNKCFSDVKSGKFAPKPKPTPTSNDSVDKAGADLANASLQDPEPAAPPPKKKVVNCTCNMPLCVCEEEEDEAPAPSQAKNTQSNSTPASSSAVSTEPAKPKPKPNTAAGASAFASMMGGGSSSSRKYDLSKNLEDQCRDAVKDGDAAGVTQLLEAGARTDWRDRQGMTLLHMACMFNHTDIALKLVAAGADPNATNRDKETCLDLAPATLGFKIKDAMA